MNFELNREEKIKTLQFPIVKLNVAEQLLFERTIRDAREYLNAEAVILQDVCDVDATKLYEKFNLTSTYAYCIKIMGLSEFIANACIGIARKGKKIPELKEAIDSGEITVSKAVLIVAVITEENKEEWIDKAKTLSKNKLERAVADEKPELKVETLKPSSKGHTLLTISISEEFAAELQRLREVESKPNSGLASYAQILRKAVQERLERVDPVRRAARAKRRSEKCSQTKKTKLSKDTSGAKNRKGGMDSVKGHKPQNPKVVYESEFVDLRELHNREHLARARLARESIDAETKHAVNQRDNRRCKARMPNGTVCASGLWTQIHHITEVRDGGTNDLSNLITLCGCHHRQWHAMRDGHH